MTKGWERFGTDMGSYRPYADNVEEDDDDALVFMDEDSDIEDGVEFDTEKQMPWRILIVDDDADVHQSTLSPSAERSCLDARCIFTTHIPAPRQSTF